MRWRNRDIGNWCLGTAQLGFDYGISNRHGRPSLSQAREIVAGALNNGVKLFDTATAYGDSQKALGQSFEAIGSSEQLVITKLSDAELLSNRAKQVISDALQETRVPKFFGLLAHSQESLKQARQCQEAFALFKQEGLIDFGGVSVYHAKDALAAIALDHFDIIQMPLNVLDRSAITFEVLQAAQKADKLLVFRSALLQGILTMDAPALPPGMEFAAPLLSEWQNLCAKEGIPSKVLALQIAAALAGGFPLVIGAELATQVQENAQALQSAPPELARIVAETASLAERTPENLRNPSLWPQLSKTAK